ncbi:hypothetical protein M3Y99_00909000 [Aphelenchoides fujianensis]|nr:hypothetical protein M3Y99_00909000 [Aphelenchoides fujianensis]
MRSTRPAFTERELLFVHQIRPSRKWWRRVRAAVRAAVRRPHARQPLSSQGSQRTPYNELVISDLILTHFSAVGRYMQCSVSYCSIFLVVDLLRNTRIVFEPREANVRQESCDDFVFLNATTLFAYNWPALSLFRLFPEDGRAEKIVVRLPHNRPGVLVFTEIRGTNVEDKPFLFKSPGAHRIQLARLDVDEARVEVDCELESPAENCVYGLSADGRFVYAFNHHDLHALHVLDVAEKKWAKRKLSGEIDPTLHPTGLVCSSDHAYFFGRKLDPALLEYHCCGGYLPQTPVYRCSFEELEWRELPVGIDRLEQLAPIVNAESGGDDGLLLLARPDRHTSRIHRLLFRTPDSLLRLSVDALRRSRLDWRGSKGFHAIMSRQPAASVLPSVYPNMQPIPRVTAEKSPVYRRELADRRLVSRLRSLFSFGRLRD